MAIITKGDLDPEVNSLKDALDAFEREHPGAQASLYRQNNAAIRLRIIDQRFEGMGKSRRHSIVWDFLAKHVAEETLSDVSLVLAVAPKELKTSLANFEFEQPVSG